VPISDLLAGRTRPEAGVPLQELALQLHNILSLKSFGPFGDVEFHMVAFIQRLESTGLDSGMVHENIIPGIAPDKSVAFFIVKPLNYALFFHFSSSLFVFTANPVRRAGIYLSLFPFHSKPQGS
jgi:hypothetical protein